jgi:hypothetical protein
VLLTGGAAGAYARATLTRRRRELREAGYVVVDDMLEAVEVELEPVIAAAIDSDGWA